MQDKVRILFVCGGIEPGRDGVGDYAQRLAAELCLQGHQAALAGIRDPYSVRELNNEETRTVRSTRSSPVNIPTLRISSQQNSSRAFDGLSAFAKEFRPDYVSLQFVPYAFHPRGFCFGLGRRLMRAVPECRRHVFYHELSVGLGTGASMAERFQGFVQGLAIRAATQEWQPMVTHTHAQFYQNQLSKFGIKADLLPLISNIPVSTQGSVCPVFDELVGGGDSRRTSRILAGYFGSFYEGAAGKDFVHGLSMLAQSTDKEIVCVLAGRQNPSALTRWSALSAKGNRGIRWVYLGELPPPAVSRFLQGLDFGIAATPWELIAKSGSVAAMLDHGLPVLVPRNDFRPRGHSKPSLALHPRLVRAFGEPTWTKGDWLQLRVPAKDTAGELAAAFLNALQCHV